MIESWSRKTRQFTGSMSAPARNKKPLGNGTRIILKEGRARGGSAFSMIWPIATVACFLVAAGLYMLRAMPLETLAVNRIDPVSSQIPAGPLWTGRDMEKLWTRLTTLEGERATLTDRIAVLEAKLNDVTGSLGQARATPRLEPVPRLGVDAGTYRSMGALRIRLGELRRAFPAVATIAARAVASEATTDALELKLLLGPFASREEALSFCAKLGRPGLGACADQPFEGMVVEPR